jgi:hypothetical protein
MLRIIALYNISEYFITYQNIQRVGKEEIGEKQTGIVRRTDPLFGCDVCLAKDLVSIRFVSTCASFQSLKDIPSF